ncbi:RNase A-like domain-containing protein [Streptomyces hebeiensis]
MRGNAEPSRARQPTVRERSAAYTDPETAEWATRQVLAGHEQAIRRWLARTDRGRLAVEAAWPSRDAPVGHVRIAGEARAVRAARVVLRRDSAQPRGFAVHASFPVRL